MDGWGDLRLVPAAVAAWSASVATSSAGGLTGGSSGGPAGGLGGVGAAVVGGWVLAGALACLVPWAVTRWRAERRRGVDRGGAPRRDPPRRGTAPPNLGPALAMAAVAAAVAAITAHGWVADRAWIGAEATHPDASAGVTEVEARGRTVAVRTLEPRTDHFGVEVPADDGAATERAVGAGGGAVGGGAVGGGAVGDEAAGDEAAGDEAAGDKASARDDARAVVRFAVGAIRAHGEPWRGAAGTVVVVVPAADAPRRGDEIAVRGVPSPSSYSGIDGFLDGRLVSQQPSAGWRAAVERARAGFERALAGLPPETGALVRGMVLGDTSAMDPDTVTHMRASGLAHLTAVSGAHFAIVAATVGAVVRRLRARPSVVALVTLGACAALAVTVTGGGSVARAIGMVAVAAIALIAGRRHQAVPALAATVVVLVVIAPGLARDVGLGLSVSAVAGIALLTTPLAARLARWIAAPLAQVVAMTLAAQVCCLPLLALIDADVGPWAVAANAVAAPFAIPVTVLGVSALAVAVAMPGLAQVLAAGAGVAAWPVLVAARAFSRAPGGGLRWPDGWEGAIAGAAVAIALAVAVRARGRVAAGGALAALAVTVLAPSPLARLLPPELGGAIRGWTVAACDVGQGDALLVTAGGATVMVDAGPADGSAARCLEDLGVTRIDLLVLTHEHADHTGGAADVAEAVPVRRVWVPPGAGELTRAAVRDIAAHEPSAGDRVTIGGVGVTVLQVGGAPRSRDGTEVNDSSVVVLIDAGGLTVAALGDLEIDGQRALLATGAVTPVDVVKVAHHGSADQEPELARALRATVALVSAGADNHYGHPAPEAIALYAAAGARTLRTDECGHVLLVAYEGMPALVRDCPTAVAG